MGKGLTRRQKEILTFIQRYGDAHGYPPSVREIGQALGLTSSSTVHSHLSALEKKGYVRRDPSKPRALEILKDERDIPSKKVVPLPIVGHVTAGLPILAQQNIEDYFPLPQEFVRSDDCFILRVRGDSMIDAGIFDGDLLVNSLHSKSALAIHKNEALDKILEDAQGSNDPEKRKALYWKAQEMILEDAPIIKAYQQAHIFGISNRLDWSPWIDNMLFLYDAKLK